MSKTVTSIFMVPTLKIDISNIKENGFINAYIGDLKKDLNYENCIYLLFKPSNLERFREFLDSEYNRTENIVEDYDYEQGYVVVVYKLNDFFKDDFDVVKSGKYSETSTLFRQEFSKIVRIKNEEGVVKSETSLQHLIFQKSLSMKLYLEEIIGCTITDDMEVWQTFVPEKETLDIEEIIKQSI